MNVNMVFLEISHKLARCNWLGLWGVGYLLLDKSRPRMTVRVLRAKNNRELLQLRVTQHLDTSMRKFCHDPIRCD